MSRFGALTAIILALLADAWVGEGCLFAQTLSPVIEGDQLTVTYLKGQGVDITVESSFDLCSWAWTSSSNTLLEDDNGRQTIKSGVPIGAAGSLYLRLRLTQAWTVELAWDAVPDPDVAGYRLYYYSVNDNTRRRVLDVGNATTATVSLPEDGSDYSFAVTCYDAAGFESEPSDLLQVSRSAGRSVR